MTACAAQRTGPPLEALSECTVSDAIAVGDSKLYPIYLTERGPMGVTAWGTVFACCSDTQTLEFDIGSIQRNRHFF